MLVKEALYTQALEKGLRQSTLYSYERLLARMGLLDTPVDEATAELCAQRLWEIDNPNTRRSAAIACRSVLGLSIKIPRGVPRRYDLPSEDTLRLALMMATHEPRGLLMMYAGLRIGEACAVTAQDVSGEALVRHDTAGAWGASPGCQQADASLRRGDHAEDVRATRRRKEHPRRVQEIGFAQQS